MRLHFLPALGFADDIVVHDGLTSRGCEGVSSCSARSVNEVALPTCAWVLPMISLCTTASPVVVTSPVAVPVPVNEVALPTCVWVLPMISLCTTA